MRPGGVTQADIHGHDGDMWEESKIVMDGLKKMWEEELEKTFDEHIRKMEEEMPQRLIIEKLNRIIDDISDKPGTIQLPKHEYELFKIWWLKNASSSYEIGDDMHYRSWHITKENM